MKEKKSHTSKRILFIAENLRIGGIQRLLLDECYQLLDWGYQPEILSLNEKLDNDDILLVDRNQEELANIKISYLPRGKIAKIFFLRNYLKHSDHFALYISHSTTGSAFLRIASILLLKRIRITLQIHQLMTLSDKKQKKKRIYQALSANNIQFSSYQFLLDWNVELENFHLVGRLLKPRFSFNRMGIFLPRLQQNDEKLLEICKADVPHLIFLSRISTWKGYETFSSVTNEFSNEKLHTLVVTTGNANRDVLNLDHFDSSLVHFIFNQGVANLRVHPRSIHLYPSDYGSEVRFPQSIGMNVLEMLAKGVPSLISFDNLETWPEFSDSPLVRQVNWKEIHQIQIAIEEVNSVTEIEKQLEIKRLVNAISIEEHCTRLLRDQKAFHES